MLSGISWININTDSASESLELSTSHAEWRREKIKN